MVSLLSNDNLMDIYVSPKSLHHWTAPTFQHQHTLTRSPKIGVNCVEISSFTASKLLRQVQLFLGQHYPRLNFYWCFPHVYGSAS